MLQYFTGNETDSSHLRPTTGVCSKQQNEDLLFFFSVLKTTDMQCRALLTKHEKDHQEYLHYQAVLCLRSPT